MISRKLRISAFCILSVVIISCASKKSKKTELDNAEWKNNYPFIFVHGLAGWGDYDTVNVLYSYWGLNSGSIPNRLNAKGFKCASASMNPRGSAWDRTCELYAQLSGTVVDYGIEHSSRCNHPRFGADYTDKALVNKWDEENKVNLIAHSFGGVVSRMLLELLEEGSEEEKLATSEEDLSPLFAGNHHGYVHTVVAISSPHNGVSAMNIHKEGIDVSNLSIKLLEYYVSPLEDGRSYHDCTGYDMFIDVAAEINKELHIKDDVYYFSIPTTASHRLLNDNFIPIKRIMEPLFRDTSALIGKYSGQTDSGYDIDEKWRENDGIVNLISAKAPFTEPSMDFNIDKIDTGIWNVMPAVVGDHLSLVGGVTKKYEVMDFYVPLFNLINQLE